MPRYPRKINENWVYHILQRGNNNQSIFFADEDYTVFTDYMRIAKEKYPCKIYSYVLMSNHFHILIHPQAKNNLSSFMKMLSQKYTQYVNKKYSRSGVLWQGKYKFCPVSMDDYLLKCSRYIEENPLRAGIVIDPAIYPYSSFRAKIGLYQSRGNTTDLDPIYLSISNNDAERHDKYKKLFFSPAPEQEILDIRMGINKNMAFANPNFKIEIETYIGRKLLLRKRGRPRKNSNESGCP